jgi:hypothetical protein
MKPAFAGGVLFRPLLSCSRRYRVTVVTDVYAPINTFLGIHGTSRFSTSYLKLYVVVQQFRQI